MKDGYEDQVNSLLGNPKGQTDAESVGEKVAEKPDIETNGTGKPEPPVVSDVSSDSQFDVKKYFEGYESIEDVKRDLGEKAEMSRKLKELEALVDAEKNKPVEERNEMFYRLEKIHSESPEKAKKFMSLLTGNYNPIEVLVADWRKNNPELSEYKDEDVADLIKRKYTLEPIEYKEWIEEVDGVEVTKNNKREVDIRNRQIQLDKIQLAADSKAALNSVLEEYNSISVPKPPSKEEKEEADKKFVSGWKPVLEKFDNKVNIKSPLGDDVTIDIPKDVYEALKGQLLNHYYANNISADKTDYKADLSNAIWSVPTLREQVIGQMIKAREDKVVEEIKQGHYNSSARKVEEEHNPPMPTEIQNLLEELKNY